MPAYFIAIKNNTTNAAEMETYSTKARAAIPPFLEILAVGGKYEVLEGAPAEGAVILRFPTMDDAKAWYTSPEYQAALVHRKAGADFRVVLVEAAK